MQKRKIKIKQLVYYSSFASIALSQDYVPVNDLLNAIYTSANPCPFMILDLIFKLEYPVTLVEKFAKVEYYLITPIEKWYTFLLFCANINNLIIIITFAEFFFIFVLPYLLLSDRIVLSILIKI